jgi:DNA-binding response OmpR family regulator
MVLLVDQHQDTREIYSLFFRMRGWHLIAVGHAESALMLLEHIHPLAIITEVVLPEMDGEMLCRRVRATERFEQLPLLAFTGVAQGRFDESVFTDVITKPCAPDALLARVDAAIGEHPPLLFDQAAAAVQRAHASRASAQRILAATVARRHASRKIS